MRSPKASSESRVMMSAISRKVRTLMPSSSPWVAHLSLHSVGAGPELRHQHVPSMVKEPLPSDSTPVHRRGRRLLSRDKDVYRGKERQVVALYGEAAASRGALRRDLHEFVRGGN